VRSQNAKRPARVYGAIAFYLDHKADVDKYVEETGREWEASGIPMEQASLTFSIRSSKSL